jgi:multiple sugar transport system substrate-binding protein
MSKPRLALLLLALIALGSCARGGDRTEIVIQRFFGECGAVYGQSIDVAAADSECGILTTLINRFEAENPDIAVDVNVVAWPGYPQLTAQIAARDPPDLVTMHQSVISDYQGRGLLEPMDAILRQAGIGPAQFTAAGRRGVTKAGRIFAMPWDTIGGLFHVNMRLMAQAGLVRDGRPVLPRSPEELLDQARRFRAATGKPYLISPRSTTRRAMSATSTPICSPRTRSSFRTPAISASPPPRRGRSWSCSAPSRRKG